MSLAKGSRVASPVPTSTGRAMSVVIVVLTVGVAAVWSMVALHQLSSSIVHETTTNLDHARRTFDLTRSRTLDSLQSQARVMVEDPRLKSTLTIEGIDEVTVADILGDLRKLRGSGFLMVLTPDGHVLAQAGADELRGLDLSGSSVVKKAQSAPEAVAGSWVIGGKIMDLSIMPVRFGQNPLGYLVVGQAVDQGMLTAVADQTGAAVAIATGQALMVSAPPDNRTRAVFTAVLGQLEGAQSRVFEVNGDSYVVAMSELDQFGQARPRVLVAQSLAQPTATFAMIRWMIFIPPILVVIAVLFALTAGRRVIVVRQP
jgi:hypothetical protein